MYSLYEEKCSVILDAFREKLDLYDVPFLVGGLGDYLVNREEDPYLGRNYQHVNGALKSMAKKDEMMGFVSAKGLLLNPDYLHFSAAALREFGLRYYEKFKELEKKDKIFEEKAEADAAIRSAMELL